VNYWELGIKKRLGRSRRVQKKKQKEIETTRA